MTGPDTRKVGRGKRPSRVDAHCFASYLTQAMLRRMITLLALLTGLAAAGTPAHAVVYRAVSGVEVAADAEKAGQHEACESRFRYRELLASPSLAKPFTCAQVVGIQVPTVQMGTDRAYE